MVDVRYEPAPAEAAVGRPADADGRAPGASGATLLARPGEHAVVTLLRLGAGTVAVAVAGHLLALSADRVWALVAVVTLCCLAAAGTRPATAAAGAAVAWLVEDGFGVHSGGAVSFAAADRIPFVAVAAAAALALIVGRRGAAVAPGRTEGGTRG